MSFTIECPSCERKFKTLYSLKKHTRERHETNEDLIVAVFKNDAGNQVPLPEPVEVNKEDHASYIMWVSGLTERINATFHPRFPGKKS